MKNKEIKPGSRVTVLSGEFAGISGIVQYYYTAPIVWLDGMSKTEARVFESDNLRVDELPTVWED